MTKPGLSRIEGRLIFAVPFSKEHINSPDYLGWLRDYDVIKTLDRPEYWDPVPFAEVEEYCYNVLASENDLFFALYHRADEVFVGTLRAGHINWRTMSADIGIMIGRRQYWGKGLGLDAVEAMSRWLFEELGMRRLTGGSMANNAAMVRIFEQLGFQHEARFRRSDVLREGGYCDHVYLGCFRGEFEAALAAKAAQDPA